jgi:hypothetical protein
MAAKPTLTIESLAKLGARRLAELLLAQAAEDRQFRQTLSLAIAAAEGPTVLSMNLRKRFAALAKSQSIPSYDAGLKLIGELDRLRHIIVETIGVEDPGTGCDLLWELLDLHPSILDRVDDSTGRVGDVFRTACDDLGLLAQKATIMPEMLAATVFQRVITNDYGIYDGLIVNLDEALGRKGRAALRALLLQERERHLREKDATAASLHDPLSRLLSLALRDIASCEGDADAFVDSYQDRDLSNPLFASQIAFQLVRAGRAEEALGFLDRAPPARGNRAFGRTAWTDARVAVLEALARTDEAQSLRLEAFQADLSPSHLRAYLKRLPDFDDVEAERQALDFVAGYQDVHAALAFLVAWPAHEGAARLVCSRITEIDGNRYELLEPAAGALEGRYPLAAVLLRRALIEFTLKIGRSSRYKHAARHVREIDSLNAHIKDYRTFESHEQFMARLLKSHPRKFGFWPLLRD